MALANRHGPSSLICSRQPLPALRRPGGPENRSARGAYVLAEAEGTRRVTLIGTGSEVALALAARDALQAEGVPTAVVSMPSWEAFAAQDEAYRRQVIPRDTVRVAVEAALRFGWDRWIGEEGRLRRHDRLRRLRGAGGAVPPFRHHRRSRGRGCAGAPRLTLSAGQIIPAPPVRATRSRCSA